MKASVLDFINQGDREVQLLGLCMLADPYCRGKDAALGTTICAFVHAVSQRNYDETGSPNYLTIVAQSAITSLVGHASQGEHEHVIRFGKAAADWLEARRSDEQKAELLMHRIEAHLELQQFDAAGALLDIAETVRRSRRDCRRSWEDVNSCAAGSILLRALNALRSCSQYS